MRQTKLLTLFLVLIVAISATPAFAQSTHQTQVLDRLEQVHSPLHNAIELIHDLFTEIIELKETVQSFVDQTLILEANQRNATLYVSPANMTKIELQAQSYLALQRANKDLAYVRDINDAQLLLAPEHPYFTIPLPQNTNGTLTNYITTNATSYEIGDTIEIKVGIYDTISNLEILPRATSPVDKITQERLHIRFSGHSSAPICELVYWFHDYEDERPLIFMPIISGAVQTCLTHPDGYSIFTHKIEDTVIPGHYDITASFRIAFATLNNSGVAYHIDTLHAPINVTAPTT